MPLNARGAGDVDPDVAIARARASCERALDARAVSTLRANLHARGAAGAGAWALLLPVTDDGSTLRGLRTLRDDVTKGVDAWLMESVLLLEAATHALGLIASAGGVPEQQLLLCREIDRVAERVMRHAEGQGVVSGAPQLGDAVFKALAKSLTFRRFVSGAFDWEISGVPRRWLLARDARSLHRSWRILWLLRGRVAPVLFRHIGLRRPAMLTRTAVERSHRLGAELLAARPELRALVGASWLAAPTLRERAPHLAFLRALIEEGGGEVFPFGSESADDGETPGATRPVGLFVWPRVEALGWAARDDALSSTPTIRRST